MATKRRAPTSDPDGGLEHRDPRALKPHPNNPRTHSQAQVDMLKRSIERFGFRNPVLIDQADTIVAGAGRVLAAVQLGLKAIPVLRITDMTPADKRAYVIADNRIAEQGGWDAHLLAMELGALADEGFDAMELLGEAPSFAEPSDDITIKDIDVSGVADVFWISINGPLVRQAEALQRVRVLMAEFPDLKVTLGTREVDDPLGMS